MDQEIIEATEKLTLLSKIENKSDTVGILLRHANDILSDCVLEVSPVE